MERYPKQVAPVKRPHFVPPHLAVDVVHGSVEDLVSVRMKLIHGANYNDPGPWQMACYECRKGSY